MNGNLKPLLAKWKLRRWEPNRKPLAQQTFNTSAKLRHRCYL